MLRFWRHLDGMEGQGDLPAELELALTGQYPKPKNFCDAGKPQMGEAKAVC